MPVLLTVFDSIIGPMPFMSIPKNLDQVILQKISGAMNYSSDDNEVFIIDHEFGIKSFSLEIDIPSPWSRGNKEMLQLSILTTEETPPMELLKKRLRECREKILLESSIYKAMFINRSHRKPDDDGNDVINRDDTLVELVRIEQILTWLDDVIKVEIPLTRAYLVPFILTSKILFFPQSIINSIRSTSAASSKEYLFVVFKKESDATASCKAIPCNNNVLKLRVRMGEYAPKIIIQLAETIKLPLVYTIGLCQEKKGNCAYEAYFSFGDALFDDTKAGLAEKLKTLDFIESFEIDRVNPRTA
jgi:hypothetical protein